VAAARVHEQKQEYQKAIDIYQQIIKDKPQSYIHYLLIGDNYLKLNNPVSAEQNYILALENNAESKFIIDRVRLLSRYFAEQNDFEQAIEILQKYRYLNPEDIDFSIDILHKEFIEMEEL
jgi:tetratricopeptide (TPR) repeat protein